MQSTINRLPILGPFLDPIKATTDLLIGSVGHELDGNAMVFQDVYTHLVLLFCCWTITSHI